jgi:hypothetical protein
VAAAAGLCRHPGARRAGGAELDRIAAHHYQTPLDPPLRLPAPVQRTVSLCERFRTALMLIECHELRDHEDYEAIKEIAAEALRGRKS